MLLSPNSQALNTNPAKRILEDPLRFFMNQSDGFNKVFNYLLFLSSRFQTVYVCQERIGKIAGITREQANRIIKQLAYLKIIHKTFRGIKKTCLYKVNNYFYTPEIVHKLKGIFKTLKVFLLMFVLTFKMTYSQYLKKSPSVVTQYKNIFLIKNILTKGTKNFTSKTISKTETITKKESRMSDNREMYTESFKKPVEIKKTIPSSVKIDNRIETDDFVDTMKFLAKLANNAFAGQNNQFLGTFIPPCMARVLASDTLSLSDSQRIVYNYCVDYYNILKLGKTLEKI